METDLNIGPQHPSMHGVLRLRTKIDGEFLTKVDPDVGFIHRGLEKIGENRMYFKFTPVVNKVDYIAAASWEHCYISCVEQLIGMEIPERAKWARMIILEIQRIISHLLWLGTLGMDLGQPTIFVWTMRERERLLDVFENIMGGRMTFGWMIIGGLRDDLTGSQIQMIRDAISVVEKKFPDYLKLTEKNHIFQQRMKGIGVITWEDAVSYGLTGPISRASGVPYDVRKDAPYLKYDEVEFTVPLRKTGDCYARYEIRREEILESIKIVKQALEKLPEGKFQAENAMVLHPPMALSMTTPEWGESFTRNECPRGEGAVFLISDGSNFPYRLRLRGPSFNNLSIVSKLCAGMTIPDMVATIATLDPVFGECDR